MSTIIDTVTDYEAKTLEAIAKVQDEVLGYIKQIVTVVDERLPEFEIPAFRVLDQIPTLEEIVTTQFAFSKKVLANQEKFAKNVVKAVKPLTLEAKKAAPKAESAAA